MRQIAMTDVELMQKVLQAEKNGEVTFTDNEGHTIHIEIPQISADHITGDFGERDSC